MTSHYRNTISVVYLLFCLVVISASASSIIRQFTDDFNTNLQQDEGAEPMQNLEKAHKQQEIASRDYKLSLTSAVTGMRDDPPSTYSLKIESFNTLLRLTNIDSYESLPFSVGGYNWTLVVYANGNKKDSGSGYISLYVTIDASTLVTSQQEVHADLRFYIFNNNQKMYFTIQDTNKWRFSVNKTMWGFSQALRLDTFKDPINGYLYDGDHCEFGVDVMVPSSFEKSELFTVTKKFDDPKFTFKLLGFSTLQTKTYYSDMFSIGGRNWKIRVDPNIHLETGDFLSMYLFLDDSEKLRPNEKIYVRVILRVLNQRNLNNVQLTVERWYQRGQTIWGYFQLISLADLKNSSKGFIVNDALMLQVELEELSSTKYLPN